MRIASCNTELQLRDHGIRLALGRVQWRPKARGLQWALALTALSQIPLASVGSFAATSSACDRGGLTLTLKTLSFSLRGLQWARTLSLLDASRLEGFRRKENKTVRRCGSGDHDLWELCERGILTNKAMA